LPLPARTGAGAGDASSHADAPVPGRRLLPRRGPPSPARDGVASHSSSGARRSGVPVSQSLPRRQSLCSRSLPRRSSLPRMLQGERRRHVSGHRAALYLVAVQTGVCDDSCTWYCFESVAEPHELLSWRPTGNLKYQPSGVACLSPRLSQPSRSRRSGVRSDRSLAPPSRSSRLRCRSPRSRFPRSPSPRSWPSRSPRPRPPSCAVDAYSPSRPRSRLRPSMASRAPWLTPPGRS